MFFCLNLCYTRYHGHASKSKETFYFSKIVKEKLEYFLLVGWPKIGCKSLSKPLTGLLFG